MLGEVALTGAGAAVLRAGDHVHADVVLEVQVVAVPRVRVPQRRVPLPVFRVGVRVDHQRVRVRPLQDGVYFFRERVRHCGVGEGVPLGRPLVLLMLARVAAHLREAGIDEDAPAARHVGVNGVEHATARGVDVVAVVDELPHHARGERLPVRVHPVEGAGEGVRVAVGVSVVVAQEGEHVPHAHQPQTHDAGALGCVDQLVDVSWLKAVLQVQVGLGGHDLHLAGGVRPNGGEGPLVRGYLLPLVTLQLPPRQRGAVRVRGLVGADGLVATQWNG